MSSVISLIRRYPIVAFAVLACVFGWAHFIAAALGAGGDPEIMPFGPLLAALLVAAAQGRASLTAWGRRLRRWSAAPRWYAVAVLAPIAVLIAVVLVNHGFGAPIPTSTQLSGWTQLPLNFAIILVLIGVFEEAGWTAFAAPELLERHGVLGTWAVLASIRILWHLPLMLTGDLPWLVGTLGNAAFQLIVLVLLTASGGHWELAAVWHAALNAVGGEFLFTMVDGADRDRLGVLLAIAYGLVALAVLPAAIGGERRRIRAGQGAQR